MLENQNTIYFWPWYVSPLETQVLIPNVSKSIYPPHYNNNYQIWIWCSIHHQDLQYLQSPQVKRNYHKYWYDSINLIHQSWMDWHVHETRNLSKPNQWQDPANLWTAPPSMDNPMATVAECKYYCDLWRNIKIGTTPSSTLVVLTEQHLT